MTTYSIYKKNQSVTPSKQVVNVFDLGYLGIEKDFPEQLSSALRCKKKRNLDLLQEEKECNKFHSKRRESDRAHYLSIKKVQDNARYIQK
jgi:hypothetical protein